MTAASSGSRLTAIVPVPDSITADAVFTPLANQPPLLSIVRILLDATDVASVVVAAAERHVESLRAVLTGAGLSSVNLTSADGTAGRLECLIAALDSIAAQHEPTRLVLVHDVRQPLVSALVVDRVIARLATGDPVVLPVLPVTDSVKAVDEHGTVRATVDRSTLLAVQYPRGFAVDSLRLLLTSAAADDFDEADAAMRAGMPIATVDGDAEAFVVDLPRDAPFIEAVIASRPR